jgi:hypothetical protein
MGDFSTLVPINAAKHHLPKWNWQSVFSLTVFDIALSVSRHIAA